MAFVCPFPDHICTLIISLINSKGDENPEELIIEYQQRLQDLKPKERKKLEEKILSHYILLVAKMAISLSNRYCLDEDARCDLFQEGIIAFKKALEKFDPSRGNKFSTYLHRTLYSHLNRYIVYRMHLVVDKRYVYKNSKEIPEEEKIEISRITPENQNQTFYQKEKHKDDEIFDRELFEKILNQMPAQVRNLLFKIANGKRLTQKEKKKWKTIKPRLINYLKENYGIESIEDFYF